MILVHWVIFLLCRILTVHIALIESQRATATVLWIKYKIPVDLSIETQWYIQS